MDILLIYSTDNVDPSGKLLNHPGRMYFGYSYISAYLKQRGFTSQLLVLSRMLGNYNIKQVDEYISKINPKVIGFTAVASEYEFIKSINNYVKSKYKDIYTIIGGVHATLNPDELINDGFDALSLSEGEIPLAELLESIENGIKPTNILNFWFNNNGSIEKNPVRNFIQDLDSLPFADREIWKEWIEDAPDAPYMILLGRGCPFQCTYCSNHALKNTAGGKYVRFRSPENIIEEIKQII